ncbi:hypothetical protein RF11_11552 [Thelohanellus kitauei]|uniref:Uncharacterized protein n=1 Tax=Thelohanellus kitauei TaxID=669202 RepID=A0A0C2JRX3_THEKT|nr:hypothetical protein RF11_11552 [Thelohanellus kitauei]
MSLPVMLDAVRLMMTSRNYARSHASYEDKLRKFVASIEEKLPTSVHPSIAWNTRVPELKHLHASAICLKREKSSLQKHRLANEDGGKTNWLKTNFLSLQKTLHVFSLQDNTASLNAVKHISDPEHSAQCRHCHSAPEWPYHILGSCDPMTNLYRERHDRAVEIIARCSRST